jgi:uncharacterized protein
LNAENKVSFFSKNKTQCPVCETTFYREELLTGRGRLIAGDLTGELRRLYDPSDKYGHVYPLIYPVMVCPSCYYGVFTQDFLAIGDETKQEIAADADKRLSTVTNLFDELDFREPRRLDEGLASYYFAIACYESFPEEFVPTIKRGLSALRAAWLCNDLAAARPGENFDELAAVFYRKARFFYNLAIEYEQNGKEPVGTVTNLGPDLDKNYGYDGVLYLSAYLELHFGQNPERAKRIASLKFAKRTVSRIFGMGKASKSKPAIILDRSRELYETIGAELVENGEDGDA